MKVLLIKDVTRLGSKGDVVEVSEGYARNYLIKNGLAVEAQKEHVAAFENKKIAREKKKKEELSKELAAAKKLEKKALKISLPANEQGHLFEKLDARKLSNILNERFGANFTEKQISLESIKELGEYFVQVKVGNKAYKIKVIIEAK